MLALFEHPESLAYYSLWYMIPVLVFVASLLGSVHCVSMCGGIVLALKPKRSVIMPYHLGRLIGYLGMGALAGLMGETLLQNTVVISYFAAVFLGFTLIYQGFKIWQGEQLEFPIPKFIQTKAHYLMGKNLKKSRESTLAGWLVGLLSVFLPCGWLYTFVLGAVATQSIFLGTLFLLAFWMGTVPILTVAPAVVSQWLKQLSTSPRRVSSSLLILAGFMAIYIKMQGPLHGFVDSICH